MSDDPKGRISRRRFVLAGSASLAGAAMLHALPARAAPARLTSCGNGPCNTTTAWMLDPDWGYPRGPHDKTRLVSRASRAGAANRIARTQSDAADMNLHLCSVAPPVAVQLCTSRLEAGFAKHARWWQNPWNGKTVTVLDRRWLPASLDPFSCQGSPGAANPGKPGTPGADPTGSNQDPDDAFVKGITAYRPDSASLTRDGALAFTGMGAGNRRLFVFGIGALVAGAFARILHKSQLRPEPVAADPMAMQSDGAWPPAPAQD